MRVLGLDLSLVASGVAMPEGSLSTIRTARSDGDWRLTDIAGSIGQILGTVDLAVVEDLPTHAHGAGTTGMVHGAVRTELMRHGVPYVLVPASTLKTYAAGRGNATKADLRVSLLQRTGQDVADEDQCDAAWLRLLGLDLAGHGELVLPQTHLRALAKLTLPEGAG